MRMRQDVCVLHLRISTPAELSERVVELLEREEAVSSLAVLRGASPRQAAPRARE